MNIIYVVSKSIKEKIHRRKYTQCACVQYKRKTYLRQPEAETAFLLPDCHHGEFAIRVVAFLCRNSFHISNLTRTTILMCNVNTLTRIFMDSFVWYYGCILSFNAICVRCRLQRGQSGERPARFITRVLSRQHCLISSACDVFFSIVWHIMHTPGNTLLRSPVLAACKSLADTLASLH